MKKKVIITIVIVLILMIGVIIGCTYFNKMTDNFIINENGVKYAMPEMIETKSVN